MLIPYYLNLEFDQINIIQGNRGPFVDKYLQQCYASKRISGPLNLLFIHLQAEMIKNVRIIIRRNIFTSF